MEIPALFEQILGEQYSSQNSALEELDKIILRKKEFTPENDSQFRDLFKKLLSKQKISWPMIQKCLALFTLFIPSKERKEDFLTFILDISQTTTFSFFKFADSNCPLLKLNILQNCITENIVITEKTVLSLARHCALGFLHDCSFLPLFFPYFNDICEFVVHCSPSHYHFLLSPLMCSEPQVQIFFLTLWVKAMQTLHSSFFAHQALVSFAQTLIYLTDDTYTKSAAMYLLEFTKSSPAQIEKILPFGEKLVPQYITIMKHHDATQSRLSHDEDPAATKPLVSAIQRARAHLFTKHTFSSVWEPMSVALIVQARVLMWGPNENQMKKGDALGFSEIESVELTDAQTKGNKNVLVIKTKKEYKFAFESQNTASQWANVLQSQKYK